MNTSEQVVIIGSGPAGWTAAIYAARASLTPSASWGSQDPARSPQLTTDVENTLVSLKG